MAATPVDLSGSLGGQTTAVSSVGADGIVVTLPPSASALRARAAAAGTYAAPADGDPVPLDADTWMTVWQAAGSLPAAPVVLVAVSSGTATVYLQVL